MKNRSYGRGAAFERKVVAWKRHCRPNHLVVRSAGSHGPFDVVVITPEGNVALISCRRDGRWSPAEVKMLREYKKSFLHASVWRAWQPSGKGASRYPGRIAWETVE